MAQGFVAYIEQDCTVQHQGRTFESGGAAVREDVVVAYLGANGVLTDWHGRPVGSYRITAKWRTPRSYISTHMHQVVATVQGHKYTGRSAGEGMVYRGRRLRQKTV